MCSSTEETEMELGTGTAAQMTGWKRHKPPAACLVQERGLQDPEAAHTGKPTGPHREPRTAWEGGQGCPATHRQGTDRVVPTEAQAHCWETGKEKAENPNHQRKP